MQMMWNLNIYFEPGIQSLWNALDAAVTKLGLEDIDGECFEDHADISGVIPTGAIDRFPRRDIVATLKPIFEAHFHPKLRLAIECWGWDTDEDIDWDKLIVLWRIPPCMAEVRRRRRIVGRYVKAFSRASEKIPRLARAGLTDEMLVELDGAINALDALQNQYIAWHDAPMDFVTQSLQSLERVRGLHGKRENLS